MKKLVFFLLLCAPVWAQSYGDANLRADVKPDAAASSFLHNYSDPTSTGQNTFLGFGAGNKTMGPAGGAAGLGSQNTAIGYQSLLSNTTGKQNSALGVDSLSLNTTGFANVAIGQNSLPVNTTGWGNTSLGVNSLQANTTGLGNTALGLNAGFTETPANANVSGINNVWLGYQAGPGTSTQLTNSIAVGYLSHPFASNHAVFGNGSITITTLYGNLSIGGPLQEVGGTEGGCGSWTDFVVDGADNKKITSATYTFVATDVGGRFQVTAGAGWTTGNYTIMTVAGGAAFLSASPAAVGTGGGTANVNRGRIVFTEAASDTLRVCKQAVGVYLWTALF